LIEHYAGAFPTWLAPIQVKVIPIADRHNEYAKEVAAELRNAGIRIEVDTRTKSTNYKIRDAQMQKVPYMAIVGDKEIDAKTVSIRLRTGENLYGIKLNSFIARLTEEINKRQKNSIFKS